jgi:hypothetical protein
MKALDSLPHCAVQQAATLPPERNGSAELERLIKTGRSEPLPPAQLHVGTVLAGVAALGALQVDIQGVEPLPASVAASCLLVPQAGDLVQLLLSQQGCWIVQVLERGDPLAPRCLELGDAEVSIHSGVLRLQAERTLELQARDVHIRADSLQETAARKQSDIQGWSSTRAAFVDVRAERQLNLFGGVTTLLSDALLKVDASQIHMG